LGQVTRLQPWHFTQGLLGCTLLRLQLHSAWRCLLYAEAVLSFGFFHHIFAALKSFPVFHLDLLGLWSLQYDLGFAKFLLCDPRWTVEFVLAVLALALFWAATPRLKTFAVSLFTIRFCALTESCDLRWLPSLRIKSQQWLSLLVPFKILTVATNTGICTRTSCLEAFTVALQTAAQFAFTCFNQRRLLCWRGFL
jgi:hypothetical protein